METTEFIEPWFPIEEYPESNKGAMEEEAEKEIATGHPLYGKKLHAIARREDKDDVLFRVGTQDKVAVLHLTWSGHAEAEGYPCTAIYESLSMFISTRMKEDVESY